MVALNRVNATQKVQITTQRYRPSAEGRPLPRMRLFKKGFDAFGTTVAIRTEARTTRSSAW